MPTRQLSPPAPRDGVLVTRPEPDAGETSRRLIEMGWRPVACPMLRIQHRPPRLSAGLAPQAILVTSGNALPALPAALHGTKLLAVGAATAAKAAALGFTRVHSADGDAEALIRLVCATGRPQDGPLLLPHGLGQGAALRDTLRRHGFRVIGRAVYAAHPARALDPAARADILEGAVGAALFYSGATALAFVRAARRAELTRHFARMNAVAISARAAAPLRLLPWQAIRVASQPSQDELLACL